MSQIELNQATYHANTVILRERSDQRISPEHHEETVSVGN